MCISKYLNEHPFSEDFLYMELMHFLFEESLELRNPSLERPADRMLLQLNQFVLFHLPETVP